MISVECIKSNDIKYCTHCGERAEFKININNPKVVQYAPVVCLCTKCVVILKRCLKFRG